MSRKRLIILLLISIFFGNPVHSKEIIRVGFYENYPKYYTDKNSNISGFHYSIINYIALKEDWKLEFVKGTFEECYNRLIRNEIDILPDIAFLEERQNEILFSDEYILINWGEIYHRKSIKIKKIEDLDKLKIGLLKKSIYSDGINGIINLGSNLNINPEYYFYNEFKDIENDLIKNKIDAGIFDRFYEFKKENKNKVSKSSIKFYPNQIRYGFSKNNSDSIRFKTIVDNHLRILKRDYESIYYKEFNKINKNNLNWLSPYLKYILFFVILIFTAMFSFIISNIFSIHRLKQLFKKIENSFNQFLNNSPNAIIVIKDLYVIDFNEIAHKMLNCKVNDNIIEILKLKEKSSDTNSVSNILAEKLKEGVDKECVKGLIYSNYDNKNINVIINIIKLYKEEKIILLEIQNIDEYISAIEEKNKKIDELKRLNKIKNIFLSNIDRELRNPINNLYGVIDLLNNTSLNSQQKEIVSYLSVIKNNFKDISNYINDIIDIENKRMIIQEEEFNLENEILVLLNKFNYNLYEKKIEAGYYIDPKVPQNIIFDKKRLNQLLSIFLSNSIKYLETGYILLKVDINVYSNNEDGILKIEIIDTGKTLEKEERERIFDIISNFEDFEKKYNQYYLLNLYIAKYIIDIMDGSINIEENKPEGNIYKINVRVRVRNYNQADLLKLEEEKKYTLKVLLFSLSNFVKEQISYIFGDYNLTLKYIDRFENFIAELNNKVLYDYLIIDFNLNYVSKVEYYSKLFNEISKYNYHTLVLCNIIDTIKYYDIFSNIKFTVIYKPLQRTEILNLIFSNKKVEKIDSIVHKEKEYIKANKKALIMICEDNPIGQLLLKVMLENKGFDLVIASDGGECLDLLYNKKIIPDLILMDIQMPVISGYDVVKKIRSEESSFQNVPIIAVTAFAFAEDRERFFEIGINDYVSKPFTEEVLLSKIYNILNSYNKEKP